jgi:hypothetical protein
MKYTTKHLKLIFVSCVSILLSCEKENKPENNSTYDSFSKISIPQNQGILVFSDYAELNKNIDLIASLSMDERIRWGQENGIKTHQIIYDEACTEQEFYSKNILPNSSLELSPSEMQELGLSPHFMQLRRTLLFNWCIKEN